MGVSTDYNADKWGKLETLKVLVLDTEHFIVFIDHDYDLDWITSDEYDAKGHKDISKHHDVVNKIALLECKPLSHFDEKTIVNYKRLLGEALARSLKDDYAKALNILEHAEGYIKERGSELARKWYLDTAGKTTLMIFLVGIYVWIFRASCIEIFGKNVLYLYLSMVSGALGALLSIIFRMGKESLDCLAGKEIHQRESIFRIIAGMLSAYLGALLVSADLFLPVFSKVNKGEVALVLVGFIAGMSERLAPSILGKIENGNLGKSGNR
ncbi:hypothetical protein CWO84_15030 [Methylomonas sp. Kb3]|uniref:hypothetical protein n=1 Tax=Methylomonas sp. Kb3 TaxID=1611544 RepID=UPI000C332539|nr:hypothetical protein [Methylomonas sp. Kb3]PKD39516.1 hypothetical protein CWO84_15030 [Methylomonas sp. Kb3]